MAVPNRPSSGAPIDSTWGGLVHDTVVAQDIQHGKVSMTLSGAAEVGLTVTFPRPFGAAPDVVATIGEIGGSANRPVVAKISAPNVTTTSFQLVIQNTTGVATSLTFPVWWIAIGPRA